MQSCSLKSLMDRTLGFVVFNRNGNEPKAPIAFTALPLPELALQIWMMGGTPVAMTSTLPESKASLVAEAPFELYERHADGAKTQGFGVLFDQTATFHHKRGR
jgi:hypothetical protein